MICMERKVHWPDDRCFTCVVDRMELSRDIPCGPTGDDMVCACGCGGDDARCAVWQFAYDTAHEVPESHRCCKTGR